MDAAERAESAGALQDRITGIIAAQPADAPRIERLRLSGRTLWLKRPERPRSLRWRIQKGDPRGAYAADLRGLRFMAAHGVPAPTVVMAGAEFFVTEDAGRSLDQVMKEAPELVQAQVASAAARSLAALHRAGARHGRPKLRDICWDGHAARLIDFERFQPRATWRAMGADWVILLHSLLETHPHAHAAFAAVVRTYRDTAPPRAVAAGETLIRKLGYARPALKLAQRLWPHNREIAGAAYLYARFSSIGQPAHPS